MIPRRVIAHFRKQEWTAIAIDFVIVVAGVFIGMQVSNWNQVAKDRQTETAYLHRLQEDLRSIETELRTQTEFEEFQAANANLALALIDVTRNGENATKLRMALIAMGRRRTLKIESPTFVDLQSSGRLEIIADPALRAAVISYYFTSRRFEAIIESNNATYVDAGYVKFLMDAGVRFEPWDRGVMGDTLPESLRSISDVQRDMLRGELIESDDALTRSAADAEIWATMPQQLSWRAAVAAANVNNARHLMSATTDLDEKISAYLEKKRP